MKFKVVPAIFMALAIIFFVGVKIFGKDINRLQIYSYQEDNKKNIDISDRQISKEVYSSTIIAKYNAGYNYRLLCYNDSDYYSGISALLKSYKDKYGDGLIMLQNPKSLNLDFDSPDGEASGVAAVIKITYQEYSEIIVLLEGNNDDCIKTGNRLRKETKYAEWFESLKKSSYIMPYEWSLLGYDDSGWTYVGNNNRVRHFLKSDEQYDNGMKKVNVAYIGYYILPLGSGENFPKLNSIFDYGEDFATYSSIRAVYGMDCNKKEYVANEMQWINSQGVSVKTEQYAAWGTRKIQEHSVMHAAFNLFCSSGAL